MVRVGQFDSIVISGQGCNLDNIIIVCIITIGKDCVIINFTRVWESWHG
jgi:hypothetical protein